MKTYNIAVLKGDGIGPDVINCAIDILDKVAKKHGFAMNYSEALIGGIAIDETGNPLPDETIAICKKSNAVMLGAVGGPKWDDAPIRPEAGLLGIRKALGLFANLRPAIIYDALKDASPLKAKVIGDELDILVVRELTGGIYFGEKEKGKDYSLDTMKYSINEVKRIATVGFESAMKRNKILTSVDKANVLESSRLWRKVVIEVAKDYPEVTLNHMYVDNAAMQLVRDPHQFDVIVTSNMFGDILSDEASMITGSIGMLPSASLAIGTMGLYEPVHGSAPDIAGQNKANPIATILSVAMMLRFSFKEINAANDIEKAVNSVLDLGYRTGDIAIESETPIGTNEMSILISEQL
ncbi:MAG: 3-isopropylmalate dehydrogenase [Clostridiales bacterium]|nr:3-isopropylmalate dehydrogenase [Clostridiales bacterium]